MFRCEVCETRDNLIGCSDGDQPVLDFCPAHYIEHVEDAHGDNPLAGCKSLDEARAMLRPSPPEQ